VGRKEVKATPQKQKRLGCSTLLLGYSGIPEISSAVLQIPMMQSWIILNALCDTLLGLRARLRTQGKRIHFVHSLAKVQAKVKDEKK